MSELLGKPWCMFAGERTWDRDACADFLDGLALTQLTREQLDARLMRRFGSWIAGWATVYGYHQPTMRTDALVSAIVRWDAFLGRVAVAFEQADRGTDLATQVELVAAGVVPLVVELTNCDDAWYQDLTAVLVWYCEHAGVASAVAEGVIEPVVEGRFASWIEPTPELIADVATSVATAVARVASRPRDALELWIANRPWPHWLSAPAAQSEPAFDDPHVRFINGAERARDPKRADRMTVALDACRQSASAGEPLTFERLAAWQQIVLDDPEVWFRDGVAYAKAGRERYGLVQDIETRFEQALRDAGSTAPLLVRAARVYLDVSYFHPFPDGNARAARLAFDHVLTSAGHGLHAIEPLIRISWAVDVNVLVHVTRLLHQLVGPCAWLSK
ncbi:MAG: Fic family protein [Kofleriaceae bacterium]